MAYFAISPPVFSYITTNIPVWGCGPSFHFIPFCSSVNDYAGAEVLNLAQQIKCSFDEYDWIWKKKRATTKQVSSLEYKLMKMKQEPFLLARAAASLVYRAVQEAVNIYQCAPSVIMD